MSSATNDLTGAAPRRPRSRRVGALGLAVVLGAGGTSLGLALSASASGVAPNTIEVSTEACAPGWVAPRSGTPTFEVDNVSRSSVFEVSLVGANEVFTYGELEMVAPGTTVAMPVVLPPGRYAFACESFTGATTYSRTERVTGPAVAGAHPYRPVELDQVQQATIAYQASLIPYLHRLERDTETFVAAVQAGDLARARALWLPAHLDYERLGAAYDTFGNFNEEIDGRPQGLVGGVHSAQFIGFLRLEYGLWHGQSAAELAPIAHELRSDVDALVRKFPSMVMPINDLALRTHEILENALQFELTGETDEGSNTNLATTWANTQGDALALHAITPLLHKYAPRLLRTIEEQLASFTAIVHSYERPDGSWVALQALSGAEREQLDAALSGLLEQLSNVPDLLEIPIQPDNPND